MIEKIWKGAPHFTSLLKALAGGKEVGFSFNLTDRCPVGCNCYWRAMERVQELGKDSDEAVLEFFKKRKEEGKLLATIVGGEPYVNPGLLRKVVEIMPANWVVTSATTPLMRLPKTTHFVSIDGKNSATHDKVRNMIGLYDRILRNLRKVRDDGEFPVYIHTVLNRLNFQQIEEITEVWRQNKLADGIVFSTMTPIKGAFDEPLRLSDDDRSWAVDELRRVRKTSRGFLCMTTGMIDSYRPEFTRTLTPETCGTARLVASYDAAGVRIPQCILSEKADCTACGCVITSMFESVWRFPPELSALRVLAKMYTP